MYFAPWMTPVDHIRSFEEPTNFDHIFTFEFVDFQVWTLGICCRLRLWSYTIRQSLKGHQTSFQSQIAQITRWSNIVFTTICKNIWNHDFDPQFWFVDILVSQHMLTLKIFPSKSWESGEYFQYPQFPHICSRLQHILHFFKK